MKAAVWPEVVAGLLSLLRGTSGFRAPETAGDGVPVFDQAEPGDGSYLQAVVIGTGYGDRVGQGGTYDRNWANIGVAAPAEENGRVNGYVVAADGDRDATDTVRTQAFTLLASLADALPSGTDLGVTEVLWVLLEGGDVTQVSTPNGVACVVEFTVNYQARLTA